MSREAAGPWPLTAPRLSAGQDGPVRPEPAPSGCASRDRRFGFRDLARLVRPRVCLLAAGASLAGFALARPWDGIRMLLAPLLFSALGAFLLAAGCSALNQVQERREDGLMRRTAQRPIPAGRLSPGQGLGLALALLGLSLGLLVLAGGWTGAPFGTTFAARFGAALGTGSDAASGISIGISAGSGSNAWRLAGLWLAVIVLYNGMYTPLKKRTPLCMLVGGLAGALPPAVGWLAAGGPLPDHRLVLVTAVLYVWQVPHFGLFARLHREDYRAAGFPAAGLPGPDGASRYPLAAWFLALAAGMLAAPALGLVAGGFSKALVAVLALGPLAAWGLARDRTRLGFALVNACLVAFLAALALDSLRPWT
jgi:protoheme IX farnesyltransferase